jgi:hypothetical protein
VFFYIILVKSILNLIPTQLVGELAEFSASHVITQNEVELDEGKGD